MAFVSIDNPDGIQHHGGQMDWCRISNTRVAIITHTKDNKALLQEINYIDGETVVGIPTFLKQIPSNGPTYKHMRSFVRYLSEDRLFVMVPSIFVSMAADLAAQSPCAFVGSIYYAAHAPAVGTPIGWSCMTLQRNPDGTYTQDSVIDIDTSFLTDSIRRETRGVPIDIFIDNSYIQIRSLIKTPASNRYINNHVLNMLNGRIQTQTQNWSAVVSAGASVIMNVREKLTPAREVVRIYAYGQSSNYSSQFESWLTLSGRSSARLVQNPYNAVKEKEIPSSDTNNPVGMFVTPAGWLPISKTDHVNSLLIGASLWFNNGILPNYLNGVQTAGGVEMMNPLDVAWVTDTLACAVGYPTAYNGPEAQYPFWPGDAAMSMHPSYESIASPQLSAVRKLTLSFRNLTGQGLYLGPFDPIDTGMYFKTCRNEGNMIHRIDDTAFWLIGCFRDSVEGEDKLGVITVKA